jgi:hypothetical protein
MKRLPVRPRSFALAATAAIGAGLLGLAGCADEPQAIAQQPAASSPAQPATAPQPYKPVATNLELMESIVAHAAEEYWQSVRFVVDLNGETAYVPETDEDWEEVWAAGVSLAESGNLLMMPPRAVDDEWIRLAGEMVDAGAEAAAAALSRDPEAVLAAGEVVYNVCVACHERYVPDVEL